jgi:flavin-dependent dehydrogenase
MSANCDVAVVGGRVAGASTALLLARAGARVTLVDRSAHGTDTVSTHGLMRAGVLQLSRWGLLDDIVAAGTPSIERTTFHYPDGDSVEVGMRPTPGVPALYAPRRYLLDRILVDAAAAAGVHVRHEATVTALLRGENARVTGIRVADRDGTTSDLPAAITVGADGVRSGVATEAGADIIRRGRSCSAMLYRYYAGLSTTGYEWAYGSGDAAGFIPTNDGLTGVFVGTTPARLRALRRDGTQHAFATLLAKAAPRLAERVAPAEPVGRMHGWAGVPGFVRRSWGPGWALVGDAGYFKDPITTHGMTDALRDAELLADAILETLAGMVPEAVALKRYQATRDQLSTRLFEATEPIASYAWDLDQVRALLRQASSAMREEVEHLESLPNPHMNEQLAYLSVRNTAFC